MADTYETPAWLRNILLAVMDQEEDAACAEGDEHEEGCDRCAWVALTNEIPHRVYLDAIRWDAERRSDRWRERRTHASSDPALSDDASSKVLPNHVRIPGRTLAEDAAAHERDCP
jgi:hypothetical protein